MLEILLKNFRSLRTIRYGAMSWGNVDFFVTSASSVPLYEVIKGDSRFRGNDKRSGLDKTKAKRNSTSHLRHFYGSCRKASRKKDFFPNLTPLVGGLYKNSFYMRQILTHVAICMKI